MQTEVAHHGRDQRVVDQLPGLAHRDRQHGHDRVTVDDRAGRVDGEATVGVAVVREAEIGPVIDYGLLQIVQMRRAAAVVDVEAVGFGVDRDDRRRPLLR